MYSTTQKCFWRCAQRFWHTKEHILHKRVRTHLFRANARNSIFFCNSDGTLLLSGAGNVEVAYIELPPCMFCHVVDMSVIVSL